MDDFLPIYLHTHLAGAGLAVDLLRALRDKHQHDPLSAFTSSLLMEVEADHAVLMELSAVIKSNDPREQTEWLSEQALRLKVESGPGTLEALEFLSLAILGKLALWRALHAASASDERLRGVDFARLISRAQDQHQRVESCRLEVAKEVFAKFKG